MRLLPVVCRILPVVLFLLAYGRAPAQSHPDDVYWDDRFNVTGVSDSIALPSHSSLRVLALASYNDIVFAGGNFFLPGKGIAAWNTAEGRWSALGEGVEGTVNALCLVGDNLYVGGSFSRAGQVATTGIACWNITTRTWSAVGGGINGNVICMEYDGTYLYAAGEFTVAGSVGANCIARWNGAAWKALGSGGHNGIKGGHVKDLAVYQGKLYAALIYGHAGADTSNRDLVMWDGAAWTNAARFSAPNSNGYGLVINALAVYNGTLVVGGAFDTVGTTPAAGLVQWDGVQWRALDSVRGTVSVLSILGDDLYVGGSFNQAGQILASNIAIRDMKTGKWSAAGSGTASTVFSDGVLCMVPQGGDMYIGGNFQVAGALTVNCIARWKPQTREWKALAEQASAGVVGRYRGITAFANYNGELAAVGDFLLAGNVQANAVALWNGQQWRAASGGLNSPSVGTLYCVAAGGGNLYVGGDFKGVGGSSAAYLAQYNGMAWRDIGAPGGSRASNKHPAPWPEIHSLYHTGNRLYAGGEFTVIGTASANCIAEWNGQTWSMLGSGVRDKDEYVYAMAVDNTGALYAGGNFNVMGGVATGGVARWDGSAWSALGGVFNGTVCAIAVDGQNVYVAGRFSQAGNALSNNIAWWDGTTWRDLNGGTESAGSEVLALALHSGKLYAAGRFLTMGGILARNIAVWDMQTRQWEPLGSGVDGSVSALAVYNGDLYAGGMFLKAGGRFSSNIARWTKQAVTAVDESGKVAAVEFRNYPNPASETTVFSFSTTQTKPVQLVLQDMVGREVVRIVDGVLAAGNHTFPCSVGSLPSGVYTAVLKHGEARQMVRIVVVR